MANHSIIVVRYVHTRPGQLINLINNLRNNHDNNNAGNIRDVHYSYSYKDYKKAAENSKNTMSK